MRKVTVLMTTYNEDVEILKKSIDSILNQSFSDFEYLIVVDNPNNLQIIDCLESYRKKDDRVRYIINDRNMGLPLSLNRGIDGIETEYIARMDADDIAVSERLEKQLVFLEKNPEVDLVGANMIYIDQEGEVKYSRGKTISGAKKVKKAMKYINFFSHPTFFGKTEVFKKYKYRNLKYSQDYDFLCRLLEDGRVIDNLQDYLLYYRQNENVSDEKRIRQRMTYFVVQTCYRKGILSKSDVVELVEKEILKLDYEKELVADKSYSKAFLYLSQKNIFGFISNICKSILLSNYQRRQFVNLIVYAISRITVNS